MPNYPVSSTASFLSGVYTEPYMIRNDGSVNVYLGQDSSVTPDNREMTLSPGSALMWSGKTELWAVTAKDANGNATATVVELLFTGSGAFTPGPSTVTSLLANAPVLLNTYVIPFGAASGQYTFNPLALPFWTDVSEYASLLVTVSVDNVVGGQLTPVASNYIDFTVSFNDTGAVNNDFLQQYNPQWLLTSPTNLQFNQWVQVPISHPYAIINAVVNKAATSQNGNVTIRFYGSNESITAPRYVSQGNGFLGSLPQYGSFTQPITSTPLTLAYIATRNGPATLGLLNQSTTSSGFFNVGYADNGVLVSAYGIYISGQQPGQGNVQNVILPMRPIYRTSQAFGSTGQVVGSLNQ